MVKWRNGGIINVAYLFREIYQPPVAKTLVIYQLG